jgi:heterotetrameric sarcosine oxidase gamma subunit
VAESFGPLDAELAAARESAALADLTAIGKVQVEGEAAALVIRSALGGAPEGMGAGWQGVYCLRPDLYLALTPPGGEGEALTRFTEARDTQPGLVTVTDLTHGLAAIGLLGPRARDVLSRLCALDVSDEAFPNETARATSVAKTRQVVVRSDVRGVTAFTLVGARSLAAYLWAALLETGREFEITPLGAAAVEALALGPRD